MSHLYGNSAHLLLFTNIGLTTRMAGKSDKTIAGSQIRRKTKLKSTGLTAGQG
jgi:hypothetical protein